LVLSAALRLTCALLPQPATWRSLQRRSRHQIRRNDCRTSQHLIGRPAGARRGIGRNQWVSSSLC